MAYKIPSTYVLPGGRLRIQADEGEGACIGTIVELGITEDFACFRNVMRFSRNGCCTTLRRTYADPDFVPNEEPPYGKPEQITVDYERVVFNRETAQEVKIGDDDFFIINTDGILALIPPE